MTLTQSEPIKKHICIWTFAYWCFHRKHQFSPYFLDTSEFNECLLRRQAENRIFNLLLTVSISAYPHLTVLITKEGPGMPRRPWTQSGTRLLSTRTFIWSRYCALTRTCTHTDVHTRTISKPPAVVHLLHMLWATEADVDILYSH